MSKSKLPESVYSCWSDDQLCMRTLSDMLTLYMRQIASSMIWWPFKMATA